MATVNLRIKSGGNVVFEGVASWGPPPAAIPFKKRRRSEDDNNLLIRIPKKKLAKPPPPKGPAPQRPPPPSRPPPSARPAPMARRAPDHEDDEGNLVGFVVPDDSDGKSGMSGSEAFSDEDEDSDEEMRRPTLTTMRQKGIDTEGLLAPSAESSGGGKKKSAEDHQKKRSEMAQRRKRQAEKQAEKNKKETIDRILNMKGAKGKREEKAAKEKKTKVESGKKAGLTSGHCRLVSNRANHQLLAFSSGLPLPPLFR